MRCDGTRNLKNRMAFGEIVLFGVQFVWTGPDTGTNWTNIGANIGTVFDTENGT